jgi:uncharacterized protein YfaS (alpha-2-macroglobulin family)
MRRLLWFLTAILLSVSGAALSSPEAQVSGGIDVVQTLPADGASGVATNAAVTAIFDRPIIPLGVNLSLPPELENPLIFDPPLTGRGEWVNTSIYLFRPEPQMAGGVTYTVSVSPDLRALDGAALSAPFSWSFTTTPPRVVSIAPRDGSSGILLNEPVVVTFNQPMDRESVERALKVGVRSAEAFIPISGTFSWMQNDTVVRFTPDERYQLDTQYKVIIEDGIARSAGGGAALSGAPETTFFTVPPPAVIRTSPEDGARNASPYGGITIYFASPMNIRTLAERVIINPEPWREYDRYYSDYDNSYTLSFPTEPSTDYTITLLPGMEDIYGNAIAEERVIRYRTGRYDPELRLQAPFGVGFYNGRNEMTQVFVTHRNISRIDLELYQVPVSDFVRQIRTNSYDPTNEYTPLPDNLIKAWTVEANAPENQLRYDLIDLGTAANAYACSGAPPSRLQVGDLAVVVSDPDPVRARREPVDGEIITLLYRDYTLPITAGPVCADGMLWWKVELRGGEQGWVTEGIDAGETPEYWLDVRDPAVRQAVAVTDQEDGALRPGIYYLQGNAPEVESWQQIRHFLVVGTANLTLKYEVDSLLIWATDVQTGQPIPNAPIAIFDRGVRAIASGTTDSSGLLSVPLPRRDSLYDYAVVAVLETDAHFGVGVTSWTSGVEGWDFGYQTDYAPQPYRGYIYTDRPIYRPGQPVYFRGIIRARDDVTYTLPNVRESTVYIYDNNGEVIFREPFTLTPFGTFSGSFTLAEDAGLGSYVIAVRLPHEREDSYFYSTSVDFSVAEYRAPEFQVTVTPERSAILDGDPLRVLIESRYFFGGAVSGAEVEWRIVDAPYAFPGDPRYSYIDYERDSGARAYYEPDSGVIAEGSGVTDAQGSLLIDIPTVLDEESSSRLYTFEATVSDESGQAVSGRTSIIVHKGAVAVGIRPDRYVGSAGMPSSISILTADVFTGEAVSAAVTIEVIERRWYSVQERDAEGRTVWNYEVENVPVTTGEVTTAADGKGSFTFTPPNGGVYLIRASIGGVRASTYLWVSSQDYVAWRQQNSNRIDLIADATDYKIGDTAEILIAHPFQGETTALIAVERGSVLSTQVLTLDTNSYVLRLPIEADYAPNVYVTALIVKGVDENNPIAAFRMGMVQLSVETTRREIALEIEPDAEQAGPGDTVNYTIRATNYLGEPVRAEIGVGLTDLAVLSIAPPNSTPLLRYFYGQQGIGVRTSTPLTINTDLVTQTILDTIKGGGGGFGEGGIFDIREDFVDTPYWNGALTTDENGEATFAVTLPDNLTTWRLDARAVTAGADETTLVGQATFDLISTKPVLIRPVTPRFFVVDDRVVLAAVVNNNTDRDLSAQVALEAAGVTFASDSVQTVEIAAGGRARVEWLVTVDDVEAVDLTFFVSANDGEYTDASKPPLGQGDARTLPVHRYTAPTVVGTAGMLPEAGERQEQLVLPADADERRTELVVEVERSLAAPMVSGLDYLRNFPHQCVEQTVSRFLPNIMTYRALTALGIEDRELERNLTIQVSFGVQRLAALQRANGGWGWYGFSESDPLVSAYALIGLVEAREQGFPVDNRMIERAIGYLRTTFVTPSINTDSWRLDRQAFVLYALARANEPDIGRMNALYDYRASLSLYAKALLAVSLPADDRARIDTLISDLFNSAILSAAGVHWEEGGRDYYNWNTNTRSTSIILMALAQLEPESQLLPNVVRYLITMRSADAWETTQETAWAVMGLTSYALATGDLSASYSYDVSLNAMSIASGQLAGSELDMLTQPERVAIPMVDLLRDEANRLIFERSEGGGALYYTAYLSVYQPVPTLEPYSNGIVVQRRYTNAAGETVTSARVGELIQARVTIIAPTSLHYVVIEDPIPAGAEAVDPNLLTSQQIGTQPEINAADPLRDGWGWWWFTNIEFRDEMVVLAADYLPEGAYEFVYTIRPGLPGEYNVLPPTGYEFYFPDVMGRGAGSLFTIES